jgi:hypothetical protein
VVEEGVSDGDVVDGAVVGTGTVAAGASVTRDVTWVVGPSFGVVVLADRRTVVVVAPRPADPVVVTPPTLRPPTFTPPVVVDSALS